MHVGAASCVVRSVLRRQQCLSKSSSVFPRLVSTGRPFPFPSSRNPTPHEIFHLPPGASQDEIKTRYYELVKVYHPDATRSQHDVSPSVRDARFRAITHAYGALRGRNALHSKGSAGAWDYYESRDEAIRAELRRRSRRPRSASSSTTTAAASDTSTDDAQLRYTLMAFVLVGMIAAVNSVSSHLDRVERHSQSAAANLAQARAEAQVHGMERRRNIRERVREFHESKETVNGSEHPGMRDVSEI